MENIKYTKNIKDNYNIHYIHTNKFKTITVSLKFKRPIKKDEITIRNFMSDILYNTSFNYTKIRDIASYLEELYDLKLGSDTYKSGNYIVSSFGITFLNEKYTEIGMMKKSLDFLFELLLNPNVKDNKFNKEAFILTKENMKNIIDSEKDNPSRYSSLRLKDIMCPNSSLSYHMDGYLEDLNKINESNLYEYYKDFIENDFLDIFVIGDIDEDNFNEYFKDKFLNHKQNVFELSHFSENELLKENVKVVKEIEPFNQSKLAIGIKLFNLTEYERKYTLQALSFILGGSGDSKLFKKVRTENSLCYYINASPMMLFDQITISSGINASDATKVIELVDQVINEIKNGNITDEELNQCINTYVNGCEELYDSPGSIINTYLSHEYLNTDLIDEKISNMKNMTKEKIVTLANKMDIDTIYLLEGVSENEN